MVLVARINQKLCFATAIISDDNRKRITIVIFLVPENVIPYLFNSKAHERHESL
ncbi:hypothetical protein D027_2885 [Vibrio parahaemolyticus 861]|nr:hypothetical protein D035_3986 [Vibrio parahaemolyticus VP250]ETX22432.1 hypothetical protein D037_3981 [Vibrio parahaemolyticus IDH02640]ETY06042.1 hypothetical protein D039_2464 [Vibrio parahaemolyticus EKP-028]EUC23663.1 hypothetical protein D027_2885 [Vibrio parahaemolyticus 861]EVU12248.1 hypothetical protein D046_6794 [Vibrio parahaemolyticus V-223/04]EWM37062.1 hypothetical protein D043_2846 [Vibrio parahaemolyticus EKP-021]